MNLALNTIHVLILMFHFHLSSTNIVVSNEDVIDYYPNERSGLIQLRDFVNSSLNLHGNWTGPPCINNQSNWVGIACSNGHVTEIILENVQMTGFFPNSFLQNITFLTRVSFSSNLIVGNLPSFTSLDHLVYVSFSYNKLSGPIPNEYIALPQLNALDLRDNALTGVIPPFDQPSLKSFNVSYNNLKGSIPKTAVLQRFPKSSFHHNRGLCGSPLGRICPVLPIGPPLPTPYSPLPNDKKGKKKKLETWTIALIAAAAALVPIIVIIVFLCYYRKVRGKEDAKESHVEGEGSGDLEDKKVSKSMTEDDPERRVELEFFDKSIPNFDLDELLRASAEVLGKGKLGTTYKVMLESGSNIAVKRLKEMNGLAKKEFVQQMQLMGKMRHENLVGIISFYYSKEEKLVVYEYISHGNLFQLLHENRGVGREPLNWRTRMSIIKDIAKGLTFLHQSLPTHKVPHGNLKSSNIMIQSNHHSKLTDFGFFPLLPSRKLAQKLAIGRSPEFIQEKKLTHKTDVYCFGIVLLEIITGRIPGKFLPVTNEERIDGDLSDWVRTVVNNDWSTDILDIEILATKEGHDEMLQLTEVALECTVTTPENRPKMSHVLRRIEEIDRQGSNENE